MIKGFMRRIKRTYGDQKKVPQSTFEHGRVAGIECILIELKAEKKCTQAQLKKIAGEALEQINSKHYDVQLNKRNLPCILKYGVAFCGKTVEIVMG